MVKKLGLLFLLVLVVFILAACSGGSYAITIGGIDASQNELSGKYQSFSGHYFKKVTVADGETLAITFKAKTEKGKLLAKVINSDGKTVKTLDAGDTTTLQTPDHYKLQVEGKHHKGNFTLSWKIE